MVSHWWRQIMTFLISYIAGSVGLLSCGLMGVGSFVAHARLELTCFDDCRRLIEGRGFFRLLCDRLGFYFLDLARNHASPVTSVGSPESAAPERFASHTATAPVAARGAAQSASDGS